MKVIYHLMKALYHQMKSEDWILEQLWNIYNIYMKYKALKCIQIYWISCVRILIIKKCAERNQCNLICRVIEGKSINGCVMISLHHMTRKLEYNVSHY